MILVFDMDGTLTDGDSWAATHSYFGTKNTYLYDYFVGKISYEKYLELVCSGWMKNNGSALYYEDLERAVEGIEAREGLKELIAFAKKNGWKTGIISAGIDSLSNRFFKEYEFDFTLANGFEYVVTDGGRRLTGKGVPRVPLIEKGRVLEEMAKGEEVISVGDTRFDVPMFKSSVLSIAMNPDDECALNATHVINDDTFYPLIDYLEKIVNSK